MLYFFGVIIWIAQIILDLFVGVGEALNELIEMGLALLLYIYFQLRGVNMNNPAALLRLISNFIGSEMTFEFYPGTLVTIDFTHKVVKAEQNQEKLSSKIVLAVAKINKLAEKAEGETGGGEAPLNVNGTRKPPVIQKPMNQGGVRLPNGGV